MEVATTTFVTAAVSGRTFCIQALLAISRVRGAPTAAPPAGMKLVTSLRLTEVVHTVVNTAESKPKKVGNYFGERLCTTHITVIQVNKLVIRVEDHQ
jgi:hypothetical protein